MRPGCGGSSVKDRRTPRGSLRGRGRQRTPTSLPGRCAPSSGPRTAARLLHLIAVERRSWNERFPAEVVIGCPCPRSLLALGGVFPPDYQHRLVAFVRGFIDRSETFEGLASTVSVAAWAGPVSSWGIFDAMWRECRAEAKIQKFHMTDYARRKAEYSCWSEQKRHAVVDDLLALTHSAITYGRQSRSTSPTISESVQTFIPMSIARRNVSA